MNSNAELHSFISLCLARRGWIDDLRRGLGHRAAHSYSLGGAHARDPPLLILDSLGPLLLLEQSLDQFLFV